MGIDVHVIGLGDLLKGIGSSDSLADMVAKSIAEAAEKEKPVSDEEITKAREYIRVAMKELITIRKMLDRGVNTNRDGVSFIGDRLYFGQAHAYLNTAGIALDHVKDLLQEAIDGRQHDRECGCMDGKHKAAETPTEAPPAETSTVYASSHGKASEPESGATAGAE